MSIYQQWGVEPIINVSGSVTRLGGAPMPKAVLDAFCAAAHDAVPLDELQAAASNVIAEATGAEAGIVTSGAAAGLALGTAAILTGYDLGRMERLPHTEDFPHEFVVAREHRNGYDHAVRAAGARFVEVGFHEIVAGAGVRRAEAWEFEATFGPKTAGVLYVYDVNAQPPLAELVKRAHARNLPVLVDAAGEVPPRSNFEVDHRRRRGPRRLLGRQGDSRSPIDGHPVRPTRSHRLRAAANARSRRSPGTVGAAPVAHRQTHAGRHSAPRHRPSAQSLEGANRRAADSAETVHQRSVRPRTGRHGADAATSRRRPLTKTTGRCAILPSDGQSYPLLEITLTGSKSAFEVCRALRRGKPSVQVSHGQLAAGKLLINPLHLNEERAAALIRRLQEELSA